MIETECDEEEWLKKKMEEVCCLEERDTMYLAESDGARVDDVMMLRRDWC